MIDREQYEPGPANLARVDKNLSKDATKWTLIVVRELRHSPEKVWAALTDPAQLREWAPFITDGSLGATGNVNLTWVGNPHAIPIKVTRAEAPRLLEYDDTRWELEAHGSGTRLTLWANINRHFVAWGAAGWHISFDVLDRMLSGNPIGRLAGADAMKLAGWQRLVAEYAKQFGVEPPKWTPNTSKS